MTNALVFEVSLPYRELSSNGSHGHWSEVARVRRLYREEARISALAAMREQGWEHKGPVRVHLLFCTRGGRGVQRYQPRDVANAIAAAKPLFDGLVDAGIVPDDSQQHLDVGSTRITTNYGPYVLVTVEPV